MRIGPRTIAPALAAAALLATASCSDRPLPTITEKPQAAVTAASPNNMKVKVKQLQLDANTLRIDGPVDSGYVSIGNSGTAIQSGVEIVAEITQGAASRRAMKRIVNCAPSQDPEQDGFLPSGTCELRFAATAWNNSLPGEGILAPGAADFTLHVLQAQDGTELASKSVAVNLVGTPSILSIELASTTIAIDGPSTTYTAIIQNPAKDLQNVLLQGYIVQTIGGVSVTHPAGGTLVICGGGIGVFPGGSCTVTFSVGASNANGVGTLVPGAALFELDLNQSSTNFDVRTVPVTLDSGAPKITSLTLASTQVVIGGDHVGWTAELQNYGFPLDNVLLQGYVVQTTQSGTAETPAGGVSVSCGAGTGVLPTTAQCTVSFNMSASSGPGGTLVPGVARFVLHMYKTGGTLTELDSASVNIFLTDASGCFPGLPKPQVTVESRTWDNGFDHVELDVPNYSSFPDALFAPAPNLEACGLNTSSPRSWVNILRADDRSYVFGFCSFGQASDLNLLWYSWPLDQSPPAAIIVQIEDRQCNLTYESDPVTLPAVIQ